MPARRRPGPGRPGSVVISRQAASSSCSAWPIRSAATKAGSAVWSAMMPISVGPFSPSMPTTPCQDALGGGDVDVAGAGDHVDRRALVGAVGEHGQGLGAADGVDFGDAQQGAGGEHGRVRLAAELLLRRGRDRDLLDARRLRRDHVHDDRGRVGDEPAGDVDARPLDREEPGGDAQAGGGLGVPALGELGLVDDPGAAGRLLEGVPDLGVQRFEGVVDDRPAAPGCAPGRRRRTGWCTRGRRRRRGRGRPRSPA